MSEHGRDIETLRDLAKRYMELCRRPEQEERRDLWRRHNSLQPTRPLIYLRGGRCWGEVPDVTELSCTDEFFRAWEHRFRLALFRGGLGDDSIFEPWIALPAAHRCTGWGLGIERTYSGEPKGSWKHQPPIQREEDVDRLIDPRHEIDEEETSRRAGRLADAVGDILPVVVDRRPAYWVWSADLSTDLGHLRGIENFMYDMCDRPAWLHRLMARLSEGVLRTHDQAEAAGDFSLLDHENQAMPYAAELDDPQPNGPVPRSALWGYMAAQEFTLVSPAMHEEFLLRYQLPILSKFGLSAYGCCEDLTEKIDMLRQIPNLRRIAVAPRADVRKCAERIGTDYVISWRPNPAEMVCCGFDADHVRAVVRDALDACRGQTVDITLKDVDTIQDDPSRLTAWTRAVREVIDECA